MDELMARGKTTYESNCAACHQATGEGIPGMFPAISNSPVATGPIAQHLDVVLNGKGAMMPAFRETLSPVELAAVVTYQRNALGNGMADMIQPSAIKSN
jgi:cytochrome c oxidase subunit 2